MFKICHPGFSLWRFENYFYFSDDDLNDLYVKNKQRIRQFYEKEFLIKSPQDLKGQTNLLFSTLTHKKSLIDS